MIYIIIWGYIIIDSTIVQIVVVVVVRKLMFLITTGAERPVVPKYVAFTTCGNAQ